MQKTTKKTTGAKRVALYRQRAARTGHRRIEVSVPHADVACIRAMARLLSQGGAEADTLRAQLSILAPRHLAKTGSELVALLRQGTADGFDLDLPPRACDKPRKTGF